MKVTYWNVMIDIGFWARLTQKKIEQYKLDDSAKPIIAKYRLSNKPDKLSFLTVDAYSFGDTVIGQKTGPVQYKIQGQFINTNTVEIYNDIDIAKEEGILIQKQRQNFQRIVKGQELSSITEVKLLIFGDFKKHMFKYQFLSAALDV